MRQEVTGRQEAEWVEKSKYDEREGDGEKRRKKDYTGRAKAEKKKKEQKQRVKVTYEEAKEIELPQGTSPPFQV